MHRIIHNSPVSRSPKFVRPPSNTRSVSRSLQVVRPPSNTRPSTRVDVRGAVPSVQPPISAADIGALMLLGLQNPKSILFTLALAILAQAPGAEAAPYEEKPAWVASCNVPAYGKTGMIECQLNTQLTAGYSLVVAGGIPGHGIFSVRGDVPYANPTTTRDTTIPIPQDGRVKIDLNNPVEADHNQALADCSRKHMPEFHLCLVPNNAGPQATLGYDHKGKIKNPFNIVDPQQLADKLNGPSGPKCATFYRQTDPSMPGTTVRVGGVHEAIVINSCGVAVGPGGPLSPRNVEVLPNGVVRLHYRPDPTSGPTSGQWAGAQINLVDREMGYGNYSMAIGGIPVEQTQGEIGIIRSIFLWADQPWLSYLKLGEIFGWPLKEEWRNIQREIDFFEIGKFNDLFHAVAQWVVQHWNVLGNVMPISPNISEAMTYTCEWLKDSITFGLKQAGLEKAWRYINQLFIPAEDPGIGVIANIWKSGYKAEDSTTHAPSNGIRQWFDIRSVTLPSDHVPLTSDSPTVPPGLPFQPGNTSLPPASPTGAPESGASSAISGGGIAGIAVGGVVVLGVIARLAYALFRRAAAAPQQPAVVVAPAPLNQIELQPASVVSIPGSGHVVVDVAALQQPAREVASDPLNEVVEGAESQQPETIVPTPVDNAVVVELQVVAALQQPETRVPTPVDHAVVEGQDA